MECRKRREKSGSKWVSNAAVVVSKAMPITILCVCTFLSIKRLLPMPVMMFYAIEIPCLSLGWGLDGGIRRGPRIEGDRSSEDLVFLFTIIGLKKKKNGDSDYLDVNTTWTTRAYMYRRIWIKRPCEVSLDASAGELRGAQWVHVGGFEARHHRRRSRCHWRSRGPSLTVIEWMWYTDMLEGYAKTYWEIRTTHTASDKDFSISWYIYIYLYIYIPDFQSLHV